MTNKYLLREQIDACRSGAGDLALPELAELAQAVRRDKTVADELARSQRFDGAIAKGLSDLPIPADLEQRLLVALHASEGERADAVVALPAPPTIRKRHDASRLIGASIATRRSWCIAGSVAMVLIVTALAGRFLTTSQHVIEQEQIASALGGWQRAVATSRPATGLPNDFVLPVLAVKPVRYVPFKTAEGWSAVAVDCTPPAGRPATLFIVRSSARFRVPTAPYRRLTASPGKSVAAWQSGHLLYVLVVEETPTQRLEDFVRLPSFTISAFRRGAARST